MARKTAADCENKLDCQTTKTQNDKNKERRGGFYKKHKAVR